MNKYVGILSSTLQSMAPIGNWYVTKLLNYMRTFGGTNVIHTVGKHSVTYIER